MPAEQQPGPSAEDDPLRVDQVDQVGDADAQVEGGVIKHLGRLRRVGGGVDQGGEGGLLVITWQRETVSVQDRLSPNVGFEAPA